MFASCLLAAAVFLAAPPAPAAERSSDRYLRSLDELSALQSYYEFSHLEGGRAVAHDEGGITTSEGQGYAMLRAVWSNDRDGFDRAWNWTKENLQVRDGDRLFAWKWKAGKVVDKNAATDADTDIALALILASRRFGERRYLRDGRAIVQDIWRHEVVVADGLPWLTAGNWAPGEAYPTIHVAYLAPYAYEVFAEVDPRHDWTGLVDTSYHVLRWIYFEEDLDLPPEIVWLDKKDGSLLLKHPKTGEAHAFGYDAVPIFWRVALDQRWHRRGEAEVRERMLSFFVAEWKKRGKFFDKYGTNGVPRSEFEGLPHYATVHALATIEDPELAAAIRTEKLAPLWAKAMEGRETPYYLHNWLWFDRALELDRTRTFDELFDFLRPFDVEGFSDRFPVVLVALMFVLWALSRFHRAIKIAFVVTALALCVRYLVWRVTSSLNFVEVLGPPISIALFVAELYSFSTVLFLIAQVGLGDRGARPLAPADPSFAPSVDVYIPIYSESVEILEKTLTAAAAMDWPNKTIYVCDDGHKEETAAKAREHGAIYLKGPKKHAKAGNLNAAMKQTAGDLIVVFDTDHIPCRTFLRETVPAFTDEKVGVVQTPHHFYNEDIFQRGFVTGHAIPDEQDMFNHGIQGGRDSWGGSFFVGSGAVFRRKALDGIGGFNLLSITEDIHTSQHLHAAGWKTRFVDKDLAVGLTAENLSSYLVQRRRWMLGCLQIFQKDNPLLVRGLPWRLRIGYFASLWYFLHPAFRFLYWVTPLWFLFFHLHPLFADVSILLAHLIPYMIALPLLSATLLPRWPRMAWGVVYESAIAFPMFRAMFDLFLPKSLGFKVTPKGIVSEKRSFDFGSTKLTLVAFAISVVAIGKGLVEFHLFGIEKDAYFINLGWAIYNLLFLAVALLVAWERPQRRAEERIARRVPVRLLPAGIDLETEEVSLSGCSLVVPKNTALPGLREITLRFPGAELRLRASVIFNERVRGKQRLGIRFEDVDVATRRALLLALYADPATWERAHDHVPRSNWVMAAKLVTGTVRGLLPLRPRRRSAPRTRRLRAMRLVSGAEGRNVLLRNLSPGGLTLLGVGPRPEVGTQLPVMGIHPHAQWGRVVHASRVVPGVWRCGIAVGPVPEDARRESPRIYLAA